MNLKFGRVRLNPMGFWEVENKPTPQELDFYYANKYYQEVKRACDAKCTPDELHYISIKLEQHLAIISRYRVDKKPGTLLDVGCGEGYTLDFFRKRGWDVKGIDFSSAGIRSKNLDCLDVLIIGDVYRILSDEMSSGRTYDVIFLKNVLEHVISPIELLKSLRKITSPNGIVVVTVPNDFSITQLFAQKHQHISENFWVTLPDHLNYFNKDSLLNTTHETGWECIDILADFPIDWFLFHPGSNYIRNKSVGKAAHNARIQLEIMISQQPINDVINLWSSFAKLGLGRNLTIFMRSVES